MIPWCTMGPQSRRDYSRSFMTGGTGNLKWQCIANIFIFIHHALCVTLFVNFSVYFFQFSNCNSFLELSVYDTRLVFSFYALCICNLLTMNITPTKRTVISGHANHGASQALTQHHHLLAALA